jgi:methylated-DNA-[protein]-cysteine S-methyltransferase
MTYSFKWFDSPLGTLKLIASDAGLVAALWEGDYRYDRYLLPLVEAPEHSLLVQAEREFDEYFHADRKKFDIPLDFKGTAFQKSVWNALLAIPFGETGSYADIAIEVGNPKAVLAVCSAAYRNPIAIIVPCHRVIGLYGATGFTGGLKAKTHLLNVEGTGPKPKKKYDSQVGARIRKRAAQPEA